MIFSLDGICFRLLGLYKILLLYNVGNEITAKIAITAKIVQSGAVHKKRLRYKIAKI